MFHSFVAYAAMGRYMRYRVGATLAVDRRLATDLAAACLAEDYPRRVGGGEPPQKIPSAKQDRGDVLYDKVIGYENSSINQNTAFDG